MVTIGIECEKTLKIIFSDHWDEFLDIYGYKVRKVVKEDVRRMLTCGDYSNGYAEYSCTSCDEVKKVPFRCKSRFCTTCGKIYVDDRADNIANKLYKVKHRHMVFTIPSELRKIFQKKRKLLSLLPQLANKVLKEYFKKLNRKESYTPGIVCIIHTFGRDLKWNPHVHVLVSEGGKGKESEWKKVDYFHYERLRKSWQKLLLDALSIEIGKRKFKTMKDDLYSRYEKGFYVYGKGVVRNHLSAVKYVGRYTGRPAIADSRIVSYDGENVTIYYEDHKTKKRVEETMPAYEFIKKVIRHIPDRQFKMIRYYGLYSNKTSQKPKLLKMVSEKLREYKNQYKSWRKRIQKSFGHDPLKCENCRSEMVLSDIVYPRIGSVYEMIKKREYRRIEFEIEELQGQYESLKILSNGDYEPLFN